jgi:putative membrane protein
MKNFLKNKSNVIILAFYGYFMIGLLGIANHVTKNLFLSLIPLTLLGISIITISLLIKENGKVILKIVFNIAAIAIVIEIIGVKTGKLFGQYMYLNNLGIKIFDVPIIIGLNWATLAFTTFLISKLITNKIYLQLLIASFLQVFYDFFIENITEQMGMWKWLNSNPPIENYIAWFLVALLFQLYLHRKGIKINNLFFIHIYTAQLLFMIILNFIL